MEDSETICPAFTQWVRGGYFSKVPTKVPIICLSYSLWVLSNSTHQSDQKYTLGLFQYNQGESSIWFNFPTNSQRYHWVPSKSYPVGTLVGTFKKYPPLTHWVKAGQIVSEPSICSAWTHWVIDPLPPVPPAPLPLQLPPTWTLTFMLYILLLIPTCSSRPCSQLSQNWLVLTTTLTG